MKCIFFYKIINMSKSILVVAFVVAITTSACEAQINNAKTVQEKVYGNCQLCRTGIEQAAQQKKVSKADWNESSKIATITFDSNKTNVEAVLKNIALAGYDSESFLAPEAAYNKLPDCCKYERFQKTAMLVPMSKDTMGMVKMEDHSNHTMPVAPVVDNKQSESKDAKEVNQLTAVFSQYFSLKDALVKSSSTGASASAKSLETAIGAVKMELLPTDVHNVWMKVMTDLKQSASRIGKSKDISQQRNSFMGLSTSMYTLIKADNPSQKVYYQFCPMANDGKGANWLSKEAAIKNPFYGAQMLTCGSTVETIQ